MIQKPNLFARLPEWVCWLIVALPLFPVCYAEGKTLYAVILAVLSLYATASIHESKPLETIISELIAAAICGVIMLAVVYVIELIIGSTVTSTQQLACFTCISALSLSYDVFIVPHRP